MNWLRILVLIVVATLAQLADAAKVPYDPSGANKKVIGDSIYTYVVTPWKCIYTLADGSVSVRYYRPDGVEKARVAGSFFAALNQGAERRDYYETWRTYMSGETKLVRNWYNYGIDFPKKQNLREYYYTPRYNDRKGNWVYAVDPWRDKSFSREMFYFDGPEYDAAEDSLIDARINELVTLVKEQENPYNPQNLLATTLGFAIKLLFIFGLFVLFMMTFRREAFYLWFDCKATRKITPYGNALFCRTLLFGIAPVLLASWPIASYVLGGNSTAVMKPELVRATLIGTAWALVYCVIFVLMRRRRVGARCARWELAYSICIFACLWAGVIFAIYVVFIALIAMFFFGMVFGKGGSIPADDGNPDNMYVTAWDGEGAYLTRLSGNVYQDRHGNLFATQTGGGGIHRLSDLKPFSS